MTAVATLYKTFNNYTEVLNYTTAVEGELEENLVLYTCEIYYREVLNDYKVYYKIYATR